MNLCLLTSSYPHTAAAGGESAAPFIRDFALALAGDGHRVVIVTPDRGGADTPEPGLIVHRFPWSGGSRPLVSLRPDRPGDWPLLLSVLHGGWRALRALQARQPFDCCIACWALPAGLWAYLAWRAWRVPYAVWCLGSDIRLYGTQPTTRWLLRRILRHALVCYADGEQLRHAATAIAGRPCAFLATGRILPAAAASPVLPAGVTNYVFLGRYDRVKGVDLIPAAVRQLPPEISSRCRFHLYGGGELRDPLAAEIARHQLANISINDQLSPAGVAAVLQQADFLLVPSRHDSVPVVFSEAMQAHLPLLAAAVGDLPELIARYGVGMVFPANDSAALAACITRSAAGNDGGRGRFAEAAAQFDIRVSARTMLAAVSPVQPAAETSR